MDFEETGKLGHGSFCSVFRCVRRMDGCEYAMKVSKHSVSGRMAKQRQRQEVLALAALAGCPFVVRYFSAWEEEGKQYVQVRRITRGITTHFLALTIMRWSLATLCLCLCLWMCGCVLFTPRCSWSCVKGASQTWPGAASVANTGRPPAHP